MHFGRAGELSKPQRWRFTAVLACRDLIRLAIIHCFRDVVRKPGNGFVGSVIRFPSVGRCSAKKFSVLLEYEMIEKRCGSGVGLNPVLSTGVGSLFVRPLNLDHSSMIAF